MGIFHDETHDLPGNAAVLGIGLFSRRRCMLGSLGYGTVGFESPKELATTLDRGRRFDLLLLAFDGDWRHVVSEMRALRDFVPRDVATMLVLHSRQICAASSILMAERSDFVMASIDDSELTVRLEILCRRPTHVPLDASGYATFCALRNHKAHRDETTTDSSMLS